EATDRINYNHSIVRLGFPSISTTHGKIPIDVAVRIACEVIKEFLNAHHDDQDFELILVEQDNNVAKAFELRWETCRDNGESRFQIKNGNLNRMKSEVGMVCRYVVHETTWRLKPDTTTLGKQLYEAIGPKLSDEIKRQYPNTGVVGESYPVPLPLDLYYRESEGVEQ
ncbi:1107_t:CDS:2, partial [Acaulospora morrowiae]